MSGGEGARIKKGMIVRAAVVMSQETNIVSVAFFEIVQFEKVFSEHFSTIGGEICIRLDWTSVKTKWTHVRNLLASLST